MSFTGRRAFTVFGIGQVVSIFGTSLSGFALGVWAFQKTQSVMQFALITIFVTFPSIFLRPLGGALVDRWDRRWVLIGSDSFAALVTVVTVLLVWADSLSIRLVYLITLALSAVTALQVPASSAAIQLMVPAEQFGKASGALGVFKSVSTVFAPLVAGGLLAEMGLVGILCIDMVTFVIGAGTVALIALPAAQARRAQVSAAHVYQEMKDGWSYLRGRRSFAILTLSAMLITAVFEMARVLLTPLVLGFASIAVLGTIMTAAGVGVVLGNVLMMLWGGPRRRTHAILGAGLTISLSLIVGGLRPSAVMVGAAVVAVMFSIPVVVISIEAIWLSKVPPTFIGRVKGVTSAFEAMAATVVLLVTGGLADGVFEPLLSQRGRLAPTVGAVLGVGPGRGVALMLMIVGLASLGLVIRAARSPTVRMLESAVPDIDVNDYLTPPQQS